MARINLLDKHTAELIAAGEVVERPASALKEMIENSIDSGATAITVEIKNGGNTYMRVTDNGCGIESDDIKKAFLRHATSKISNEDDLNAIGTLGFRGEALASISAVSKVEMITRTKDSDFGMRYVIEGGEEIEFEQAGTSLGTTIVVRDLFYNTPARMKFLKSDNRESNVVLQMLQRLAISNPDISFKLIKDSKQVLNTPGDNNLKSAVFTVFGKEFSDTLIPCEYELSGIKVSGFVSKPTASRKNKAMQFFSLNSRYIRTKTGMAALDDAYKNSIMVGTYPACVLNISLNPALVDVNVHPAKTEVRFSDEQSIYRAVYYATKSAITADDSRVAFETHKKNVTESSYLKGEQLNFKNKIDLSGKKQDYITTSIKLNTDINDNYLIKDININKTSPINASDEAKYIKDDSLKSDKSTLTLSESEILSYTSGGGAKVFVPDVEDIKHQPTEQKPIDLLQSVEDDVQKEHIEFKYIGQVFSTYIIVECDKKLIMIDKHAAHERILFEKLKQEADFAPQMLLSPINITLSANEYDAIVSNADRINQYGFEIEDFGLNSVLVRAVPVYLEGEDVKGLVQEMAGKLINKSGDFTPEFLDWLFHSVACRAAIKAGNKSTDKELISLADIVLNDDKIRYCPHGRPVAAELSENEIKRRFSRI